jgi:hypothetical protein
MENKQTRLNFGETKPSTKQARETKHQPNLSCWWTDGSKTFNKTAPSE